MEIVPAISSLISQAVAGAIEIHNKSGTFRTLFYLFAIIGFFALISATFDKILDGLKIVFKIFIFIPAVFIVSILNRKKRKERLKEWGEIKDNFKGKEIPRWKWWGYLILKLGIPALIIIYVIWGLI